MAACRPGRSSSAGMLKRSAAGWQSANMDPPPPPLGHLTAVPLHWARTSCRHPSRTRYYSSS